MLRWPIKADKEYQKASWKYPGKNCMTRFILLAACLLGSLTMTAVTAQPQTPPPSVMVSEVRERDITPRLELLGRIEAREEVALRARIEGVLEQRNFDGSSRWSIVLLRHNLMKRKRKKDDGARG
jgi:multidrug efflux pump subunit AcrA (membrane-fusion protein)